MSKVLEAKNISVIFHQKKSRAVLVDNVSFSVEKGKCLGILGESGSGKSMTCKAIMGLLDKSFEIKGEPLFEGVDLMRLDGEKRRKLRGNDICMILQNPMTCFDPLYRIGNQMAETFEEHTALQKGEIMAKSIETLKQMRIKDPEDVLRKYPHQLSGGMLQRVMIGLALALKPKLIIADEPTTAIDTITQYEIIKEFEKIKQDQEAAMIFISHDLGVISRLADDVVVMHNARAVEQGSMKDVFSCASDTYTRSLIQKRMAVLGQFERVITPQKVKEAVR